MRMWERKFATTLAVAAAIIALSMCPKAQAAVAKYATARTVHQGKTLCKARRPDRNWQVSATFMQLVTPACPLPFYIVQCIYKEAR